MGLVNIDHDARLRKVVYTSKVSKGQQATSLRQVVGPGEWDDDRVMAFMKRWVEGLLDQKMELNILAGFVVTVTVGVVSAYVP